MPANRNPRDILLAKAKIAKEQDEEMMQIEYEDTYSHIVPLALEKWYSVMGREVAPEVTGLKDRDPQFYVYLVVDNLRFSASVRYQDDNQPTVVLFTYIPGVGWRPFYTLAQFGRILERQVNTNADLTDKLFS